MPEREYTGRELDVFQAAVHWKLYMRRFLSPYLTGDVLEVGAGIGGAMQILCNATQRSWTALEPDTHLAERIRTNKSLAAFPVPVRVVTGTTADLPASARFDAILYFDVLEHIQEDAQELARASDLLVPGGALLVVAPAHQWLWTPFDAQIGHIRRYSASRLTAAAPPGLKLLRIRSLDSVGLLASLGNRLMLHSATPTARQVWFWDSILVRLSQGLDPLLFYRVGKSLLGIWNKVNGD